MSSGSPGTPEEALRRAQSPGSQVLMALGASLSGCDRSPQGHPGSGPGPCLASQGLAGHGGPTPCRVLGREAVRF